MAKKQFDATVSKDRTVKLGDRTFVPIAMTNRNLAEVRRLEREAARNDRELARLQRELDEPEALDAERNELRSSDDKAAAAARIAEIDDRLRELDDERAPGTPGADKVHELEDQVAELEERGNRLVFERIASLLRDGDSPAEPDYVDEHLPVDKAADLLTWLIDRAGSEPDPTSTTKNGQDPSS